MTIATREQAVRKTGLWYVVVQGIPYAFGMKSDHPATVPTAIYQTLRIGSDANISETAGTMLAAFAEKALPDIGPYTGKPYDPRVTIGDFSIALSDSPAGTLRALFAYLKDRTAIIIAEISASTAQSVTFTVDEAGGFSVGNYIYIDGETLKITAINSNQITALRGQFGSERSKHNALAGVYKAPPYWKGRRLALCRAFVEEDSSDYEIRWVGNVQAVEPTGGGSEWRITAIDELRILDRDIQIQGKGKVIAIDYKDVGLHSYILTLDIPEDGRSFDPDILAKHPYVQIGKGIVKARVYESDATGVTKLEVLYSGLRAFGTERPFDHIEPQTLADMGADIPAGSEEAWGRVLFYPTAKIDLDCNQLVILEDEHLIRGGDGIDDSTDPNGMLLKLLQSDKGDGTNGAYDTLPFGCGLPDSEIDFEWINRAREKYPDAEGTLVLGWSGEPFNIRDVIETYILKPFMGRLIPQGNGKIGLRFPYEISPLATGKYLLTKGDIIYDKGVKVNYSHDDTYTDYIVKFNRPVIGEEKESIGKWIPLTIQKPLGNCDSFYGYYKASFKYDLFVMEGDNYLGFAARRMELVELRNARPIPSITLYTRLPYWALEVGDVIKLTTGDIPLYNPNTGGMALSGNLACEVMRKEYELGEEIIKLELLPIDYGRKLGVIAPAMEAVSVANVGGNNYEITVRANQFSTGTKDSEFGWGGKDIEHFVVGDVIRAFNPATGVWGGWFVDAPYYTIYELDAVNNKFRIVVATDLGGYVPQAGDIIEFAEYPFINAGANKTTQEYRAFLADDSSNSVDVRPDGIEKLPASYSPPSYTVNPYRISIG
ncbi:MAG: hypothetical protein Kow0090_08820 [Myxococcota bacterium]